MKKIAVMLFLTGCLLSYSTNAYAYLDPGSGSYMLQILLATVLAGFFALKIYFGRVKAFFASLFSKKKKKGNDSKS